MRSSDDGRAGAGFGVPLAAGLLAAAAALAGCGAGDDGREVAALRTRLEAQTSRVDELSRRVDVLEGSKRTLEEQIAGLRSRTGAPAASATGPEGEPAADGETGEAAPGDGGVTASMGAFLLTEEGREQLRTFLGEEKKREEARQVEERRDRTRRMIAERVNGTLGEQLNLTEKQKGTVITVLTDSVERMGEFWREAREGDDPQAMTNVREKMVEFRRETETQLQQALTLDQFEKFQEMSGPGMMGFGGRPGGFGGRGPDGGR